MHQTICLLNTSFLKAEACDVPQAFVPLLQQQQVSTHVCQYNLQTASNLIFWLPCPFLLPAVCSPPRALVPKILCFYKGSIWGACADW